MIKEEHVKELNTKMLQPKPQPRRLSNALPNLPPSSSRPVSRTVTPASKSFKSSASRPGSSRPPSASKSLSSRPVSSRPPPRKEDEMAHIILDQVMVEKPNVTWEDIGTLYLI